MSRPPFSFFSQLWPGSLGRGLTILCLLMLGAWIACEQTMADEGGAGAPAQLFAQHCASCHGADRRGGMGPALLPENLERLRQGEAIKVIGEGRPATQMQGFAPTLNDAQIRALAGWIYTPVFPAPQWTSADIKASRVENKEAPSLDDKPVFKGDPLNLFVVVEGGDHHVSILDGDSLTPIYRFASRFSLHGGPKFSPNGRYVYFASRDGWLTKFDLWKFKILAEIRVGINTRNLAISDDGKYVIAANYLPRNLVLLDGDLQLIKILPATSLDGKDSSRVSAVYDAAPRKSFIAALKDIPEVWEISYDPNAAPIFDGYVHDYKMQEGLGKPGFLNPRRIQLAAPLDDFFFNASYSEVMGTSREGMGQVISLDVRKKIADLPLAGMPHLGSGITWKWKGRMVMATTNLKEGRVSIIDMETWQPIKEIPTCGPGFFLRSHENSRYAFVDSMMSPACKDTLQVIDKESLTVVKNLTPEPGKTLAHVEFTRDGRYALASLMENKGAIIVFDGVTLKEVKRIPMSKPIGKYNVWNKINRSEGTSH